ncbi:MAG: phosphate butyryltransferase [Oscillospiraceae bacterium]|nr:phosphate butyryltransferase [Oscillospiraceae bacterium]
MIRSMETLRASVAGADCRTLAVAVAQDAEVLLAVEAARKLGIAKAILVGDEALIRQIALEKGISPDNYTIVHEEDKVLACKRAVGLVRSGEADVVMKGIIDTSVILKAVLDKENGLRDSPVLSHVAAFEVAGFDRMLYVTDAAMNIAPDLNAKKEILRNAVKVAHTLGNPEPIAACLCAVEKVNPKMQATLDAAALVEANQAGEIAGCKVMGPLALDNAISPAAARHKGITDPLAGHADILLVPNIETGNVFYKSLVFMAGARNAGVIVGAKAPIVLTSRADSDDAKLNSIALALTIAKGVNA